MVVMVCFFSHHNIQGTQTMTTETKRKSATAEVTALLEGDEDRLRPLLQELVQEILEQEM